MTARKFVSPRRPTLAACSVPGLKSHVIPLLVTLCEVSCTRFLYFIAIAKGKDQLRQAEPDVNNHPQYKRYKIYARKRSTSTMLLVSMDSNAIAGRV